MRRLPHLAIAALLSGCSRPEAMTDDSSTAASSTGEASDTAAPTTGAPTTAGDSSTDAPTTAGVTTDAPAAVCGDGVVEGDEPCDDGNDVVDDGCDPRCERTGALLWTISWDAGFGLDNDGTEIAVDAAGFIYVGGSQRTDAETNDAVVRRLDADGVEQDRIEHGGALDQTLHALAVGPDGSLYMGGQETLEPGRSRAWLHKYDPAGAQLWAFQRASEVLEGGDALLSEAIVDGDAVYVSGAEHVGNLDTYQLFLHRLDAGTGAIAWEVERGDVPGLAHSDLASAPDGTVYFASAIDQGAEFQPTLARYTADGDPVYQKTYESTLGGFASAVAVHDDGSVALVGLRYTSDDGNDGWLARIDDAGDVVWETQLDQDQQNDFLRAVAWSSAGDLYVGGYVGTNNQQEDAFTARYTGLGEPTWTSRYNDEQGLADEVFGLAIGADAIYVVGRDFALDQGFNQWIRAYQP